MLIGVSVPCATLKVANRRSVGAASTSVTVPVGAASATGVFKLVETDPDTLAMTGALSTAVMLIVLVAGVLLSVPSFTTQLMLRLVSAPKLVGFWLLEEYLTLSRTAW
jgi:Kef-type K+ transport system membrane component KefB